MILSEYDFFVFDCDGVILDSNKVKTFAFEKALVGESKQHVKEFIEYHRQNGGITRQEKFKYFYDEIKANNEKEMVSDALRRFATICKQELLKVELIPGVNKFLEEKNAPAYVVTGGNEAEVKYVFKKKKLFRHFKYILGNPDSKDFNMNKLCEIGAFKGKGLYFGDALLDYQLAEKYGLDFIFISGCSEWIDGKNFCTLNNVLEVKSFTCLDE